MERGKYSERGTLSKETMRQNAPRMGRNAKFAGMPPRAMRYERWWSTYILWAPRPLRLGKLEFTALKPPLLGQWYQLRVHSVSPKIAKTGLGAERNQIRKKWRKRDRSLFARFMQSKAMPMTQKEVSRKCAMMRLSP